jgi:hypothetical protein
VPQLRRLLITGGPRTGKTTMAAKRATELGVTPQSTDDLIPLGWSEASEAASYLFDRPGPWVIEGVAVPRALRKWKARHPGEPPPYDELVVLTEPWVELSPRQAGMGEGVQTVLTELGHWLR